VTCYRPALCASDPYTPTSYAALASASLHASGVGTHMYGVAPLFFASLRQAFKDQRASTSRAVSQEVGCADVGGADGLKPRQMCFSRTLCETCVADSLRPANMRYLQVGQRVGVARYMCAV